ncbi:MAG: hypothetical protein ACOZCL_15370 [Bacillota bacterium]
MIIVIILLLTIISFGILLFAVASKVTFHFSSTTSDINVTITWLHPFLRSVVTRNSEGTQMFIYLFNKKILKTRLDNKNTTGKNKNIIEKLNPTDISIYTEYGFRDPSITGMTFGAISAASQLLPVESISQKADFLTNEDYINVDGTARLNLGRSLVSFI